MSKKYDVGADASPEQAKKTAAYFKKLMRGVHDHGNPLREAMHKGHRIQIKTTYDIKVDGRRLPIQFHPRRDGSVAYHSVPTQSFSSAVDLVRCLIDVFPEDFVKTGRKQKPAPDPHAGHHHVPARRAAAKKVRTAGR